MTPLAMFLALQPVLQLEWQLSNTASGWISSAYYAGYMVAVPVLASLTDRFDARTVWLNAAALGVTAATGFALLANGKWSAVVFQALAGASLAGTYMPGLKVMTDRIGARLRPRHVAFYTTSFTLGSSGSYFVVGQLAESLAWRTAVAAIALGPLVAGVLMYFAIGRAATTSPETAENRGRWQEVLRSADSMCYVVGYGCHMWELFGQRAWIVPFFTYCVALHGPTFAAPATLAAMIALVGMPASFAGAEIAARLGRRPVIIAIMLLSVVVGAAFGFVTTSTWPIIIAGAIAYHALIMGDSAALTSGLVAVSPLQSRGTAMALYSSVGFGAAWAGSFAIGALLDLLGGQSARNWGIAFAVVSASNLVGALTMRRAS